MDAARIQQVSLTAPHHLIHGLQGDAEKAAAVYKGFAAMNAADIADQVIYAITRPLHVQVSRGRSHEGIAKYLKSGGVWSRAQILPDSHCM